MKSRQVAREMIARGALRALQANGWDEVVTRQVAVEAGVSLGQLHYYFESKDALLLAAARMFFDDLLDGFLSRAEGKEALELVRTLIECARFDATQPEGIARVRMQAEARIRSLRDPDLAGIVRDYQRSLRGELEQSFRVAGVGRARSAALATIVLNFLESFTPHRILDPEDVDITETESVFLKMFERELARRD